MIRIFIATITWVAIAIHFSPLVAQEVSIDPNIQRTFSTQAYVNDFLNTVSGSGSMYGSFQDFTYREYDFERKIESLLPDLQIKPTRIGVIFHILYTEDLESARQSVRSQLEALNRDFNSLLIPKYHPNDPNGIYGKLAAIPRIELFAADLPETEGFGSGIATLRDAQTSWDTYDAMKNPEVRGSPAVRQEEYLNIWVVSLSPKIGSYATSPYQNEYHAGIVIDQEYFGQQRNPKHGFGEGKSLTHLVGNYLGLKDLWNDHAHCSDDRVSDTPVHNTHIEGCPKRNLISTCYKDTEVTAMTMNFMDSTYDACQFMFTQGQVRRMHAMLLVAKPSLIK